jgi:hypothetical protein
MNEEKIPPQLSSNLGLLSFVTSLFGIFFPPFFLISITMGLVARSKAKKTGDNKNGKWASIGLLISYLFVLLYAILFFTLIYLTQSSAVPPHVYTLF